MSQDVLKRNNRNLTAHAARLTREIARAAAITV